MHWRIQNRGAQRISNLTEDGELRGGLDQREICVSFVIIMCHSLILVVYVILDLCLSQSVENHSDDSSSSNADLRMQGGNRGKHLASFHQSDSDDMSLGMALAKSINKTNSLRMKHNIPTFLTPEKFGTISKAINYSLESDSFNENSPAARPSIRRKRKLKRMCVDETPVPPCGKRKRPQRLDPSYSDSLRSLKHSSRIKPLNQSIVDKIEKFCVSGPESDNTMEIQHIDENGEIASESSVSWSGDEGHEGDDELTDWAPQPDPGPVVDCWNDSDSREIRAGCRRLRDERPSFSITTGANERVARFLQDSGRSELRLCGAERDKLGQLAALYSLDLWFEGANYLLRKTNRTPCMQPTQRHHSGLSTGHKKIRTHETKFMQS